MTTSLMQVVPFDESLGDWMFGALPDWHPFTNSPCCTHTVLRLDADTLLVFALTQDSDWVFGHSDLVHYTDSQHVVIEVVPATTRFVIAGISFYPRVSIRRGRTTLDPIVDGDSAYWDQHRFGGHSFFLREHSTSELSFVAQIAFPAFEDTADLNLNWPTGEMTVELFFDRQSRRHCALWRMHA